MIRVSQTLKASLRRYALVHFENVIICSKNNIGIIQPVDVSVLYVV